MAPLNEGSRFIFEASALAALLSNGDHHQHDCIITASESCDRCLATNRQQKDVFLDMHPEDKDFLGEHFFVERSNSMHNRIAASLSDKIDNSPDVNDPDIQDFVRLLAVAKTTDRILVIDDIGNARFFELADILEVQAINCEDFTALFN